MSLDGFSMSPLALELNRQLAGGRIDKIFQPNKNTIMIWIRQPGETFRLNITINAAQPYLNLSSQSMENPAAPPVFCMVLRKHLEDGRIAGIAQHTLDRIIFITVDTRGPQGAIISKTLVVELMGKHSNVILVQNDTIIDAIRRIGQETSRVRQVSPGRRFCLPPGQNKVNIMQLSSGAFAEKVKASQTGQLAKAIVNTGQGIGPLTARELAWRAGLPAGIAVETLTPADVLSLAEAVDSIVTPLQQGLILPTVVTGPDNRLLAIAAFRLEHLAQYSSTEFATMSAALEFAGKLALKYTPPEKDALTKLVATELTKLEKKLTAISEELAEAAKADKYRKLGDILMANLYSRPGDTLDEITLNDLYSSQPDQTTVTIVLDPSISLLENARRYYTKYHKLKRAQTSLEEQISRTRQELQYLASVEIALENADRSAEVADIRSELTAAGYISKSPKRRSAIRPSRPLKLTAPDGTEILIGKNNYQNDEITFKQAQLDDIWLHTKDFPGSHVILRTGRQHPSADTLALGAQLAAYFSKARTSANAPVDYTKRRNVKKPSGAKPGFVIYSAQKTLYVTPDEAYIEQLLQQEKSGN
ncbi:fibronectin/fibrinogen-binding protein|uniref:Rqc2 homolog RqcH n=1 Tax=Dendrosporobacter quercicolus TaxID=146817 RepID=A0A1G9M628_9FIRM|nr:NFACT RNA binding domain-containing protein [Dendrosporobacter quercicolus]NSL46920.1 fibronectin/fibrinogen-binding protein [Dendrosporobacter quercicolus DSM 1736]SDL69407.1 Predicted component of the ribosome quality control (RQC) complex, YloA/Tae2 family, contains fibronectin-binding (FbpA) and DUF814 domains [Dendrosporobacter quercicolus]